MTDVVVINEGYEGGFVRIPINALREKRLTNTAKVLLGLLVNECQVKNDHTILFPYARAREELGVSSDHTARKAFDLLEACGFLDITTEKTQVPHPETNSPTCRTRIWYTIRPVEQMEFHRFARPWEMAQVV